MTEQRPCVRCARPIDQYARMCVYCNWDQSEALTATPLQPEMPVYVPPPDHRARNRVLGLVALIAMVIVAFVVGTVIHGFEPNAIKAAQNKNIGVTEAAGPAGPRSSVTLVPVSDTTTPALEQPITSAPAQAAGQQPNDATALPSDQYAVVAEKAKAQKQAKNTPVDPRTVRGHAYEEHVAPETSHVVRTEAFPEYKPLPDIRVDHETSAHLVLTVGADGRVKDVNITDSIPGATSKLIDAVQNWRFRPATENGTPVSAKVNITITLHGNG